MLSRRGALAALAATLVLPRAFAAVRPGLYNCEGCQAVAESDPASLAPLVQLAAAGEPGERMQLTGVARLPGGGPAADVVVYAHHTDASGLYSRGTAQTVWSHRHGLLRGWAKTDAQGRYTFDTIKPAPYPGETMPAHVHLFIGEPGYPPYYIDDVVFQGEFGIDDAYRARAENRGGSGIVILTRADGVWRAERNIALEPHA